MLSELTVRDILLVEHLNLEFRSGLNVLTGETGAGKSILLDALGFALGWRGRADIVRQGAEQGEVTATFDIGPDHPVLAVLADTGVPADDQLILRRVVGKDGRKKGYVNDRRVSGEVLRNLSDNLVELHGQQDDRGLLDPGSHRGILDGFGGLGGAVADVRARWRNLADAQHALEAARDAQVQAMRDADYLRHAAKELSDLDPQPDEEDALDATRRRMQVAARIGEDIAKAAAAMGADGAEGHLGNAQRWLEAVADRADSILDPPIEALGRTMSELGEALSLTEQVLERMRFDPRELEQVEERLFAIRAMARKHDVQPHALPDLAAVFASRLERIDAGDADIARLQKEEDTARSAFDAAAAKLSTKRAAAARKLDQAMAAELGPLKLERATFVTRLSQAQDPGPAGVDQVWFEVSTNPDAPAGPINKIASGGELSRFLLALKVCLAGRLTGLTMIFDEIDRGVGGATADAVGRRLAQVADGAQVLVVTHAPQVAAQGGHHFRVAKSVTKGRTHTEVAALDPLARIDEIARMLAGDVITDEARSAAEALLSA